MPAKQFAPVVVLKAGLVRFPMLSPPSDSTYWGHLRKNVPGQCRKRAEFVGHFWVRDSPPIRFFRGRQRFEVGENTCHGLWFRYCWLQAMGVTWAAYERVTATGTKNQNRRKWQRWLMDIYILWLFMDIDGSLHVLVLWGLGSWMFLR